LSKSRIAAVRARTKWVETARPNQLLLDDNTEADTDLILAGRGFGKRIDIDTLLPTPDGWVRNGDIRVGDMVYGSEGWPVRVTAAHPVELAPESYLVKFDDGSEVYADADHLWTTHTKLERKNLYRSGKPVTPWTGTTREMANSLLYGGRETNHAIPVVEIAGSRRDLPLDPYFLGVWLGDGMSNGAEIIQGEGDEPITERLQDLGFFPTSKVMTVPKSKNGRPWPIFRYKGVWTHLKAMGLFRNKHIPIEYLRSSVNQRMEVLRGLMDTDGSVTTRAGHCELSLSNERLARDAHHLICSLGFKASISRNDSWRYLDGVKFRKGKDRYRIKFMAYDDRPVFHHPRKKATLRAKSSQLSRKFYRYVKSVTHVDPRPMRCITVDAPDGLYVVTAACVLTHNTRVGAEDCWWYAYENPGSICHVIAPTRDADLKGVCFEGESGILSIIPYELLEGGRDKAYNKSELTIKLVNGSLIKGFSATEPDRLRGPQCHRLWGDELCAWENFRPGNAEAVYDMAMFGLRLGKRARAIFTTTPKPYTIVRKLMADPTVRVVTGSTYDNLENLSPNFARRILKYEGTKLGRQEIHAEVFDLEEGGVISRDHFQLWPADRPLPMMSHIIISLDTAFTERTVDRNHDPDPTACSVWGAFIELRPSTKKTDRWDDDGLEPVGCIILLDRWAETLGFPALLEKVHAARLVWYGDHVQSVWGQPLIAPPANTFNYPSVRGRQADELLIEKKGSGISLLQVMANQNVPAHPFNPGNQSKLTRLHAVSPCFAQGLVFVQESDRDPGEPRLWARPLIEQVVTFRGEGTIAHDDDVDTTTQAMLRFMAMGHLRPKAPVKNWTPPEVPAPKRKIFISAYS